MSQNHQTLRDSNSRAFERWRRERQRDHVAMAVLFIIIIGFSVLLLAISPQ